LYSRKFLYAYKLLTYVSFILLAYHTFTYEFDCRAEPGTADLDNVLREIYVLYSDCALVRNIMNENSVVI